jgi:RNA polymerase sigma factor (sigma-70 family)
MWASPATARAAGGPPERRAHEGHVIHGRYLARGTASSGHTVLRSRPTFRRTMADGETRTRLTSWFHQWRSPMRKFLVVHSALRGADLEDVAQEVFLRLLRYERAELVEHPQAYLYKMAANVAAEWALRARSRLPHEPKWLLELTAESQPDEDAERDAASEEIERVLQRLPARQREMLKLHFAEGLGYAQIAERMGSSQRIVKRQLVKSYATLRAELDVELLGVVKHGRP